MKKTLKIILQRGIVLACLVLLLGACGTPIAGISLGSTASATSPTATPGTATPTSTDTAAPTSTPALTPTVTTTPGCGSASPVTPGTTVQQTVAVDPKVDLGSTTRTYLLHVPVNYQPQLPIPLMLIFHGKGSNAAEIEGYTGFSQLADQERFIAVYPQGLINPTTGQTYWDSFDPTMQGVDEVAFVNKVLDDVEQKLCIDTHRIDATGFSNGGNMTGMLACRLATRIAAFAPIAGNFFDYRSGCKPGRPVALLNSHGTADDVVPYNAQPDVQQWLQLWAQQDHCTTGPITFSQVADVTAMQWTNCQGDVAIFHYRVNGEKHVWPKTLGNFPTDETIWRFFLEYPLP